MKFHSLLLIVLILLPLTAAAAGPSSVPEPDTFPWVVTTASELNLREGPGTQYKVLGTFDKGAHMYAVSRTSYGNWVKVTFHEHTRGDMEGYVEGSYLIYENQLDPDGTAKTSNKRAPIELDGTIIGKIWKVIRIILIIGVILLIVAFKDQVATVLVAIGLFAGIGALIFWLLFKNGSLGGGIGAILGLIIGLRTVVDIEYVAPIFSFILKCLYYGISFPFYVLNQIQYFLSEPWRYLFKDDGRDAKTSKTMCAFFEVLKVINYILITPLRLLNAIYYNILVHGLFALYDLWVEVLIPCNEREGNGNFWLWLVLLPWRVIRYPIVHGALAILESVLWTIIDVFIPAITLYHGTDLTAGESIAGSRKRNKDLSWKSGTFTASDSSWGGIGVYFAAQRRVAHGYSVSPYRLSDNNPVIIVCRVSPGRIINYSMAPEYVYYAAGANGNPATLNKFAEKHGYTTGEWWNQRGGYWEYCLFDWQNLYNNRWRIRPLYLFNVRTNFVQHIKGGMAHWTFKL